MAKRGTAGCWLAATGGALLLSCSGCGVFIGDPIDLFGAHKGPDGGAATGAPCSEESTRVSGATPTVVLARADQLAVLLEGQHTSVISWPDESEAFVTVTLANVEVFSVKSHRNPNYGGPIIGNQCIDHARVDGQLTLQTEDGRLNETLSKASFLAYDDEQALATFTIDRAALHGTYNPSLLGERCYLGSAFRILIGLDGTHGAMVDQLLSSSCDHEDAGVFTLLTAAGGHWGTRWRN